MEHIGRDPVPEQVHGRPLAISNIDTGTAELEDFPLMGDKRRDVVFVGRIEAAKAPCCIPPKQPVGSYDRVATPTISAVEDEQVIAVIIKAIEIAPSTQHLGQWPRSQALVEYPVTQRLHRIDVRSRLC